ncbi:MAG: hypothetical protein M1818_007807 [Claussenomyces sp. TS43310]|nr:MAG: hypothetical protein M1818_007807 [Claussenomyces sp. TS43310]
MSKPIQSIAHKHYLRALSRWPKDVLRPETQFADAMRRRATRRFETAKEQQGSGQGRSAIAADEVAELEQANALYALVEGRFARKYPTSDALLQPTSNPTYYTDLIRELDEAPTRNWWNRMTNRWKGFLRFQ